MREDIRNLIVDSVVPKMIGPSINKLVSLGLEVQANVEPLLKIAGENSIT